MIQNSTLAQNQQCHESLNSSAEEGKSKTKL